MRYIFFSIFSLLFFACKQKNINSNASKVETTILPYTAIVFDELKALDSTSSVVYKYNLNEKGQIKDSVIIDKNEMKNIAKAFLDNPIDDKSIKNYYIETSYQDATIEQNNFSYTTTEKKMLIKSLTISFKSNQASTFKSLQITKEFNKKNIPIREQLFWESNNYFLITTMKDSASIPTSSSIKVVWK